MTTAVLAEVLRLSIRTVPQTGKGLARPPDGKVWAFDPVGALTAELYVNRRACVNRLDGAAARPPAGGSGEG